MGISGLRSSVLTYGMNSLFPSKSPTDKMEDHPEQSVEYQPIEVSSYGVQKALLKGLGELG